MKTLLRRRRRQLLFLCVGVTCFLTQYAALTALTAAGTYRPLANALGFVISAQLNFVLSARLTWRDRPTAAARTLWARWASYNGTALISLAVNTAVFTAAYHRIGNLPAAALGVLCGMCVTYLVCDLLIFRDRSRPPDRQPVTPPPAPRGVGRFCAGGSRVGPASRHLVGSAVTGTAWPGAGPAEAPEAPAGAYSARRRRPAASLSSCRRTGRRRTSPPPWPTSSSVPAVDRGSALRRRGQRREPGRDRRGRGKTRRRAPGPGAGGPPRGEPRLRRGRLDGHRRRPGAARPPVAVPDRFRRAVQGGATAVIPGRGAP